MENLRRWLSISPPQSRALVRYEPPPADRVKPRRRWLQIGRTLNMFAFLGVLAIGVAYAFRTPIPDKSVETPAAGLVRAVPVDPKYLTAIVERGDLSARVSASGTVEPVRLVEVSTELSGTIKAVHVDNNDVVKAGQLLAELDPVSLKNEVVRATAQVAAAKARVKEAVAGGTAASKQLARKSRLSKLQLTPTSELEEAQAGSQQSAASVEALEADLKAAEANLNISKSNLDKVRIVSPIDGIVLRRNIEPGQTVAASLQAPVLFRLAQDLDRMQIRVDIDEADALSVREGQMATFNVQALRGQHLDARVEKLYIGPEVVQGVVTYKALLSFDNSQLDLRPGMTAMADIVIEDVSDTLLIPNAALRFSPPDLAPKGDLVAAGKGLLSATISEAIANDAGSEPQRRADAAAQPNQRHLYVADAEGLRRIAVIIGATDGSQTQIVSGNIKEGDLVIVDMAADKDKP